LTRGSSAEAAGAAQRHAADQLDALGVLQAFIRATAIGPGQAAGAQLDAAVPADDQHGDLVEPLGLDGGQDRSPGRAAGFAVVVAAVLLAPSFQAQQLCVASRSLCCSIKRLGRPAGW
jgi:hypothetical protein